MATVIPLLARADNGSMSGILVNAYAAARGSGAPLGFVGDPEAHLCSASLLKPLILWVAAPDYPEQEWEALAVPAITVSDNAATDAVWSRLGGAEVLARLSALLPTGSGNLGLRASISTFGGTLVSPKQVVHGYLALQAAGETDPMARRVLELMGHAAVDFGARGIVVEAGLHPLGWKSGWFCHEDDRLLRTHSVIITEELAACVMTAYPLTLEEYGQWKAAYGMRGDGEQVLAFHERVAGNALRAGLREAMKRSDY